MKNFTIIPLLSGLFLCLSLLFFSSCNKNKSPEHVALEFQTALENYDFESAKKWAVPEAAAIVDFVAMVTPEEHKKLRQEQAAEVRVDSTTFSPSGDTAMVHLTVMNPIPTGLIEEETPAAISKEAERRDIALIKREGKWLVNLDSK